MMDIRERFWSKVDKSGECWLWTSSIARGYGHFYVERRQRLAHRFAYELQVGPIPDGLTLDHLCRVRHCVNPDHLDPVPLRENLMRAPRSWAAQSLKSECVHGHPLIGDNVIVKTRRDGATYRNCRTCRNAEALKRRPAVREAQARYRARQRAKHSDPSPVKI